jgi:hypothetical protein
MKILQIFDSSVKIDILIIDVVFTLPYEKN